MRTLMIAAAVVVLAACDKKADEVPAAADTAMADAAPAAADTGTAPGTYTAKDASGADLGTTTINADGTYVDTDKAGKQMKGIFAHKDGKDCFTPDDGKPEQCWTVTPPAADGSFTATSADGKEVLTVKPVAAAATPAPAAT